MSFDPITLEIIQRSLQAIGDEMFATMRKTAMSAVIYEVLDMGTGITDALGGLAASGAGIPAFVAVLDKAVQRLLQLHAPQDIHPGDVFASNDPYYGGVTHLNDVVLMMPVFVQGELLAWTANIAHWNDVGGSVPGSMSPDAREIFQEGLRLPAVKLVSAGVPNTALLQVMRVNSRMPDFLEGDLWAGIAAVRVGARRIEALVEKYGRDTFVAALNEFMDYGEQVALRALRTLPQGRYRLVETQDSGIDFCATIDIGANEFTVDLRDNPNQDAGPNNASRDGALSSVQMLFKNLCDPEGACNAGSFRPIRLLTRPGSVFDAREPAAFGIYYEVEMRLYDLLWRCLAPHLPERLPAGHFSSICGTMIGGTHPDTGRQFSIIEPQVGGWGASAAGDGANAQFSAVHGETYNCPVEVAEARYGLYVDRLTLNDAEGGAGRYRGGKGIVLDYRVRSNDCFLTASYSRHTHRPWAMAGGREGSSNEVRILRADGTTEVHAVVTQLALRHGDVVRVVTGNGGGYGDPRRRKRALVAADLRAGYITPEQAARDYGYVADG